MSSRRALLALAALLWGGRAGAEEGFRLGSYGRVNVGSDLRGSTPEAVNVVAHGSRIVEPSYVELDVYYHKALGDKLAARTVTTLALLGDPFHYTGEFAARLALRNLYAEVRTPDELGFWVGARMYRGDDIYLLDWWPLDEVNTVGGGVTWTTADLELAAHVGASRLLDPLQFQTDAVPAADAGAAEVVTLDRQRYVATFGALFRVADRYKVKGWLEAQGMGAGERERTDGSTERLPSDGGWAAGAQVGAWGFLAARSYANLFLRVAEGLAAVPDLAAPRDVGPDKRTWPGAWEALAGVSAGVEGGRAGLLVGAYLRRFESAATAERPADGWEGIADARPWVELRGPLQAAVDLSYQRRAPGAMSPTALDALDATVVQLAPMLLLTPTGPGSYARPQLRLVYRVAHLDEGALDLYPPDDPRRERAWVHYLGLQAEWWANSSYL